MEATELAEVVGQRKVVRSGRAPSERAWAERALLEHRGALVKAVGETRLPPPGARPLGAGTQGCVWPTLVPGVALKVSRDDDEAALAGALRGLTQTDGVVLYHAAARLCRGGCAVWREQLARVGLAAADERARDPEGWAAFCRALRCWNRAAGHLVARAAAGAEAEALTAARALGTTPLGQALGRTLQDCLARGLVLLDLVSKNLGYVAREGRLAVVLADGGSVVFLDPTVRTRALASCPVLSPEAPTAPTRPRLVLV